MNGLKKVQIWNIPQKYLMFNEIVLNDSNQNIQKAKSSLSMPRSSYMQQNTIAVQHTTWWFWTNEYNHDRETPIQIESPVLVNVLGALAPFCEYNKHIQAVKTY